MPFSLEGIIPAVWTPTNSEGLLLTDALRRNIEAMVTSGVNALLVLGSTGEFVHLSTELRKEVLDSALKFSGGTPVLTNISHTNPRVAIELGGHAKAAGAVGVSLLPPWFFPLSENDLVEFFVRIGESVGLPLTLYNFQAMTGKRLTPEIVEQIASRIQLAGLKHSAGELQEHRALVEVGRRHGFNVVTGWDTYIPETFAMGVRGCVAGMGNFVPELLVKIYRLVTAGGGEELAEASQQMRKIGDLISALEFPLNVAAAMEAQGRAVGTHKSIVSTQTGVRYNALRESMRALLKDYGYAAAA